MIDPPRLSIVIPTCKSANFRPCLESIKKNTDLSRVEIFVISNGYDGPSTDFDGCHVLSYPDRIGYTKATNAGIKASKGEFIVLLNDDALILDWGKHTWIDMLLKPFEDPKVGMTGPLKLLCPDTKRDFIMFFCCCIRRKLFDELGLLDEATWNPGGCEDIEFSILAENAGYKLVQVPNDMREPGPGFFVNNFPIYHPGEKTVFDIHNWASIIEEHRKILRERYYDLPFGSFWDEDIQEYRKLVSSVPDGGTIGELGVFFGRSLCAVADLIRTKHLRVIAVDTFEGTLGEGESATRELALKHDMQKMFTDSAKRFGIHAEIHRGFTHDVSTHIPEATFDLLFIDARHTYEAVRQDIDDWKPKMKKPGIMAGHDYGGTWAGVKQAVDETFPVIDLRGLVWSQRAKHHITVSLCTRGRYTTTLPLAMSSLAMQTRIPDYVFIYDDTPKSEWIDLRDIPAIKSILGTYEKKGIGCYIIYGVNKGQHFGDQEINQRAKDLVFRFDDDCVADTNVLEELEKALSEDVGGVGCSITNPLMPMSGKSTGKLINIRNEPNMQWVGGQGDVEHLHSCFLYRAHITDFDVRLSPRSFRGETMFSHEIMKRGYRLKVINNATIWHYQNGSGGCRSVIPEQHSRAMYEHDEKIFYNWMNFKHMGVNLYVLNGGLGDHYAFLQAVTPGKDDLIACCYPEPFQNQGYNIISIEEASKLVNIEQYNIYTWCMKRNWRGSLVEAFRKFYEKINHEKM